MKSFYNVIFNTMMHSHVITKVTLQELEDCRLFFCRCALPALVKHGEKEIHREELHIEGNIYRVS